MTWRFDSTLKNAVPEQADITGTARSTRGWKYSFICLLVLILMSFLWFLYRVFYVNRQSRELAKAKLKIFETLIHKLKARENVLRQDVSMLAENPATRHALFGILGTFGRMDAFPGNYFSVEKSAESYLVNWLEFPTELNSAPDQVELFTKVTLLENDETFDYFVYKYKINPPPRGLSADWMLGVVGPFTSDSQPYEMPQRIFSRFNVLGTVSPMEEARWVHQNINRK